MMGSHSRIHSITYRLATAFHSPLFRKELCILRVWISSQVFFTSACR